MSSPASTATSAIQTPPPRAPRGGTSGAAAEAGPARDPLAGHDLVCLSHLRWDFVFQRPQHLLCRFARERRVFYIEQPVFGGATAELAIAIRDGGVHVVTPRLPAPLPPAELHAQMRILLDGLRAGHGIASPIMWFYDPMALPYANHFSPLLVVYDCMDELSAFAGAPPEMRQREEQLLACADLVFTGGQSLYEAKRGRHPQVHAFPSSIDREHFARARAAIGEPADQAAIPHPRIGFYGVLDERLDIALLDGIAAASPERHFVLIGPVVKIDPASLPRRANIHYLGRKDYAELPSYLAGWDVAMLPFAHNASTRFISPTKTPEYLSAGCPVVSTSITDVVRPYGEQGMVRIADGVEAFTAAISRAERDPLDRGWRRTVSQFLRGLSWERTWGDMRSLMAREASVMVGDAGWRG